MDKRSSLRTRDRDSGEVERRASTRRRGMARVVHWLKNLWARPVGVQREGRGLKLVLVERRRRRLTDEPPKLTQVRAELRERLLGQQHAHAAAVMRHLARVHDELGGAGWPGVESLPAQVLGMALVQAEMLAGEGPSVEMSHLIERLRIFKVAAGVREERERRQAREARQRDTAPGVAAGDAADAAAVGASAPVDSGFEGSTGHWTGPVPTPLVIPDRNP